VAIAPSGALAYVATPQGIVIINTATKAVTGSISLPIADDSSMISSIAFTPNGAAAYAVTDVTVAVIDTATTTASGPLFDDSNFVGQIVAVASAGTRAYVTDSGSDLLVVIDTTMNMVIGRALTGDNPIGVAITRDGEFAYVANNDAGSVSVIDTAALAAVATIAVGLGPVGVAIAKAPGPACIGDCNGDGQVSVDELLVGINIVLGNLPVSACASFGASGSAPLTVAELLAAVNNALNGCPE
jgi:YVTN family beta-propeller protein